MDKPYKSLPVSSLRNYGRATGRRAMIIGILYSSAVFLLVLLLGFGYSVVFYFYGYL